jgi:hypothetical protein
MKWLLDWSTSNNKQSRSIELRILLLFKIAVVVTTVSGGSITIFLGIPYFEIHFGIGGNSGN